MEATERVRIVSGGDDPTGGSMDQPMDNHTPPEWGDETEDENTLTSWPWGEMGRPSDRGPSEGILAERPNVPAGCLYNVMMLLAGGSHSSLTACGEM